MTKQEQYTDMMKSKAAAGLALREGVDAMLSFLEDGDAKKAIANMLTEHQVVCAQATAKYDTAQAAPITSKITAPGVRFGVRCTGPDGVHMKDMVSGHWTTYPVRDMTRQEAEEVVAYELTKGTVSTYEMIDLDEQAQCVQVRSAAVKAVLDAAGYNDLDYETRKGEVGRVLRAAARMAGDKAVAAARVTQAPEQDASAVPLALNAFRNLYRVMFGGCVAAFIAAQDAQEAEAKYREAGGTQVGVTVEQLSSGYPCDKCTVFM